VLVILNGSETINKTRLAKAILGAFLSPFEINGYYVHFNSDYYEIYDNNNQLVFRPSGHGMNDQGVKHCNTILINEDGSLNEEGNRIQEDAESYSVTLFRDGAGFDNFLDTFVEIETDDGVWSNTEVTEWEFRGGQKTTYDKLISGYKNALNNLYVATGSFSKSIVEKIKLDVGEQNVIVLNIIRHPSVCFSLHQREEAYYLENIDNTLEQEHQKLINSSITTYNWSKDSTVINVKFEDIIKTGSFQLLGKTIKVIGSNNFNDLISEKEKDFALLDFQKFTTLDDWNQKVQNFQKPYSNETVDVFQHLGYSPLTLSQIVAPKE